MSNEVIRAAIEKRLLEWAKAQVPVVDVAFENIAYMPTTGKAYMAGFLLPAETQNPTQGGKHRHYNGIYQVSIYTQAGKGSTAASALTNAIEALFACPTTMTQAGINVHVNKTPSAAQGRPDGNGFWMTPVTINYHANVFT